MNDETQLQPALRVRQRALVMQASRARLRRTCSIWRCSL
jgi:hypothetical protein